jgi:hypothetical protein
MVRLQDIVIDITESEHYDDNNPERGIVNAALRLHIKKALQ